MKAQARPVGTLTSLWRYPIKSMQGEEIGETAISEYGIAGDRAYALVDTATGHIVSAKHPRKWGKLLECRAAFLEAPRLGAALPPIQITLPDGSVITNQDTNVDQVLSRTFGRSVTLLAQAPANPIREANRAPVNALAYEEDMQQEPLALAAPDGTFFDYAPLHIFTTTTLRRLQALSPSTQFDLRRFRPNLVITPLEQEADFIEHAWIGQRLLLGANITLNVLDPCPRCVVVTLPQGQLGHDPEVLRIVADHVSAASATLAPGIVFSAVAGVYAQTDDHGIIHRGAGVWFYEQNASL